MKAVWSVSFSGYEFVPLLPYLKARTATPPRQELSGIGILERLESERASLRARSDSLRKLFTAEPKIPLLWLHS
jgi:hypothetical protein